MTKKQKSLQKYKEEDYEEEYRRRERKKESKEKKKEKFEGVHKEKVKQNSIKKDTLKVEKEKEKEEEKVKIPIMELDKGDLKLKEINIDSEIPKIKRKRKEVKIPIMILDEPIRELKTVELDYSLPEISPKKREIKIPLMKLEKMDDFIFNIQNIDATIPKIEVRKREIKIPVYRVPERITDIETKPIDGMVNEELLKRLLPIEKEKEVIEEEEEELSITEPNSGGGGAEEYEENFNLLKSIFGVSKNSLFTSNAKIILVENEEYLAAVRYICWRIYREVKGGRAEPRSISNPTKEIFKREIEMLMKAEDKIFSVEFKEDEELDEEFWNSFRDRIEDVFGQGIGFIIVNKPILFIPKHHLVDSFEINPPEYLINNEKLKANLCSIMWGFIDSNKLVEETKKKLGEIKFDYMFETAKKEFERKIKSIGEPYITITKRHRGLNESDDRHYPIKVFVVKYIAKELGLSGERDVNKMKEIIHTEKEYSRKKFNFKDENIYPDICVKENAKKFANEVFEIETLFGEGMYSIKKIDETIEKYENIDNPPKRVNIVLENLTFLIHLDELIKKKRIHKKLNRKFELEFWTLDVENDKLVSLDEVIKRIKENIPKDLLKISQH